MTAPSTPIRVLLADDDANVRRLIAEQLTALGHTVVAEAATGSEAVAAVARVRPDAVLLDVHMPDGSGIDAAPAIIAAKPDTAVVFFTGDPEAALTDAEVGETGAIAFLPKPTPRALLDTTLRLAVSRARALTGAQADATAARQQLADRKLIERAKGILMRRTGSTEAEAYRILQRSSQDHAKPMVKIAQAVLDSEPGSAARTAAGASAAASAAPRPVPEARPE
jgi:response regulator NasT